MGVLGVHLGHSALVDHEVVVHVYGSHGVRYEDREALVDVRHVMLVVLLVLWEPLMVVDFERQKNYEEQEDHGVVKGHKEHEIVEGL